MRARLMIVLLLGVTLVFFFARHWFSDERAVERVLHSLAEGARASRAEPGRTRLARVAKLLDDATTPTVLVHAVDLPPASSGRAGLLEWAALLDGVDDASFELVDLRVVIEGRRAAAHSDVKFEAHIGSDEWTDRRPVAFHLQKDDGRWRVRSIDVGARPNDWPEARP